MTVQQALLMYGAGSAAPGSGWDTSKNSSYFTFSNSDWTAFISVETTPDYRPCVGLQGRDASGHWYCEQVIDTLSNGCLLGLGNSSASLALLPGFDANGWSYYDANGNVYHNASGVGYGSIFGQGDVIGIELNAGSLYFYKNGTIQNSGTAAFTGLSGVLYPMWCRGGAAADGQVTLTTVAPFNYSIPSGATEWG